MLVVCVFLLLHVVILVLLVSSPLLLSVAVLI
jgi:hypothetical protein